MQIRAFRRADTEQGVALWQSCGLTRPWNDPRKDIERKLSVQPEPFVVGEADGHVAATAMAGYDGHRGWVCCLAVEPERQGQGLGSALLAEVERLLLALGCPKVNIEVRSGNERMAAIWTGLGYLEDGATGMGKRLIPDD